MSNGFRGRHFPADFILLCVRWYLKFNVSYRQLAEMMEERGVEVHHTTIYRWIQSYAPKWEKLIRWYQGLMLDGSGKYSLCGSKMLGGSGRRLFSG